jgi:NTP pyrophosphatase (non-canonical NTP hydrolase)
MREESARAVLVDEIERAHRRYGYFTSTHEGYGVLVEEVSELLDAIRGNSGSAIEHEAIQVAAVAMRIAYSVSDDECKERSNL